MWPPPRHVFDSIDLTDPSDPGKGGDRLHGQQRTPLAPSKLAPRRPVRKPEPVPAGHLVDRTHPPGLRLGQDVPGLRLRGQAGHRSGQPLLPHLQARKT